MSQIQAPGSSKEVSRNFWHSSIGFNTGYFLLQRGTCLVTEEFPLERRWFSHRICPDVTVTCHGSFCEKGSGVALVLWRPGLPQEPLLCFWLLTENRCPFFHCRIHLMGKKATLSVIFLFVCLNCFVFNFLYLFSPPKTCRRSYSHKFIFTIDTLSYFLLQKNLSEIVV